jgi:hypothetical protein
MKTFFTVLIASVLLASACTTVDPAHQTRSGKKAYASKAPRNRAAWK